MVNFRLRHLLLTLFLLAFAHLSLQAQQTVGVKWQVPEDDKTAAAQLAQFDRLGISILEIESQLSPDIWQQIDSLNFPVYGNLGIHFPTTSTFAQPDSSLIQSIQNKASIYLSQPSVTAVGLFSYGAIYKDGFFTALKPIAGQLKESTQKQLYYISRNSVYNDPLIDFTLAEIYVTPENYDALSIPQKESVRGYLYHPNKDLRKYLKPFKGFLESIPNDQQPIFLPSDWLLTMLDAYPRFSEILQSIATQAEPTFPLPKEDIPSPQTAPIPIIILLFIWGTIAWHYNGSPLYRKSLFRYFTSHTFFINDIFDRQIRSAFPAVVIILQNALLISACLFVTFLALFAPLGQTALFHYFPALAMVGPNPFSIFLWTFGGALLISLTSIIWLFLTHKSISSLTQVATIYAWPLQLNFIFCGIAITLFSSGANHQMVVTFTVLALLLLILSFIFTSLDTYRMAKKGLGHLLKTSVPYVLIWIGVTIWITTNDHLMDVINLALNLK